MAASTAAGEDTRALLASSLPPVPGAEARRLGLSLGLSTTVAEWLLRRGHDGGEATRRFLSPKLSDLTHPKDMVDRDAAADRIARAVRSRERIVVFGDYDCDGITACAILTEVIESLGGEAVPLLASRFDGGYGVSPSAVARILEARPGLLITCDCGSSDHETLRTVARSGVDVIVIDHHLVPDEPLPALAFLNPHRPDCGFSYKGLASCGLALSIAAALRQALGISLDLRRWLDLVAIGTIADVAPLEGDNRALVRAGLALMRTAPRPGVRALLELGRVDALSPLRSEDVSFRIAPRLNAPGRLGPPDLALEVLLSRDDTTARATAARVEQLSKERRAQQEAMLSEAIHEIETAGMATRPALVVGRPGWNPGIVGIVAGRLASRYKRPVIVVGFDGPTGRGSVRGPREARLFDALTTVSDVLDRYGGHQAAAGVEVRQERLEELRAGFEAAFTGARPPATPFEADELARLCPRDDPARVVADLDQLEPCGEANPAPRFAIDATVERARAVKGNHLKLELSLGSHKLGGFAPAMGDRAETLSGEVLVVGRLGRDTWRGGNAVEISVDGIFS